MRYVPGGGPGPLRPPGSVDEHLLAGLCIRCGNCVRVCPSGIIRQDLTLSTRLLTPVVRFGGEYCLEDCRACCEVCPSGAIEKLTLADKNRRVIGRARIDLAGCLLSKETECGHCARICPHDAIDVDFSEDTWTTAVRVNEARCNGCGACLSVCPPEVIAILPVGQRAL